MSTVFGIILTIVGVIFGANALGTLSGRYGRFQLWAFVLALAIALLAFGFGMRLIF